MFYHNGSLRNVGVGIYNHQSLNVQQLDFLHNSLNLLFVKCTKLMKVSYMVVCIYQAPSIDK